jgi:hypothetical protein
LPCKSCGSVDQSKFTAEIGVHFPGMKNIDKPVVWVFPKVIVCLDCGIAEFGVPEPERQQLAKGDVNAYRQKNILPPGDVANANKANMRRWQVLHPGQPLPADLTLPPNASAKDPR